MLLFYAVLYGFFCENFLNRPKLPAFALLICYNMPLVAVIGFVVFLANDASTSFWLFSLQITPPALSRFLLCACFPRGTMRVRLPGIFVFLPQKDFDFGSLRDSGRNVCISSSTDLIAKTKN